jgi:hypothetical protein
VEQDRIEALGCAEAAKGQCLHYFVGRMAAVEDVPVPKSLEDVDVVARFITDFSLGGIRRIKERLL